MAETQIIIRRPFAKLGDVVFDPETRADARDSAREYITANFEDLEAETLAAVDLALADDRLEDALRIARDAADDVWQAEDQLEVVPRG